MRKAEANRIEAYLERPAGQRKIPLVTELPEEVFEHPYYPWPKVEGLAPKGCGQPPLFVESDVKLVNVARGKPVRPSTPMHKIIIGELELVTDGEKNGADGNYVELREGLQWMQVDLREITELHAIWVFHWTKGYSLVNDVVVQVSNDPKFEDDSVCTLFNNDRDGSSGLVEGDDVPYMDSHRGWVIDAKQVPTRFLRCYSAGSEISNGNLYVEIEAWGREPEGS